MKTDKLGLPEKLTATLIEAGYTTLKKLEKASDDDILALNGAGIVALKKVQDVLRHQAAIEDQLRPDPEPGKAETLEEIENPEPAQQPSASSIHIRPVIEVFQMIDHLLEESEGEITPAISQMIDQAEISFGVQVDNICTSYKEYEAQSGVVKAEIARLRELQRVRTNRADNLKGLLKWAMERREEKKFATDLFVVSHARNAQPAVIFPDDINANTCPDEVCIVPPVLEAPPEVADDFEKELDWLWGVVRAAEAKTPRAFSTVKVKEYHKARVALYLDAIETDPSFLSSLRTFYGDVTLTREDASWRRANDDLPEGISVQPAFHVKIK